MQEDLDVAKKSLRKKMNDLRGNTPPLTLSMMSAKAQERLMTKGLWKNAGSVALYMAVRNELDTRLLFDEALKQGKRVYLPRVETDKEGIMHYAPCTGRNELAPGAYGIPEPRESAPACLFGSDEDTSGYRMRPWPDLFLLPGVAFDRRGYRLGYGGGYYDRFLARCSGRQTTFVAIAYNFQVVDRVPDAEWDRPVNAICTDKELIWIK